MIRNARESDIPRLMEIRAAVRENQLRDASRVTLADYQWFIANPGIFVWEEGGRVIAVRRFNCIAPYCSPAIPTAETKIVQTSSNGKALRWPCPSMVSASMAKGS
jgi:hypothetical protein